MSARGTFYDRDRRSLTLLDADVRRSARFRPHATYPGSISRRLDAVMSNLFRTRVSAAHPVFHNGVPWLSERPCPARPRPDTPVAARRYTLMNDFAIFLLV